jgi:hypothetical protein
MKNPNKLIEVFSEDTFVCSTCALPIFGRQAAIWFGIDRHDQAQQEQNHWTYQD